MTLNLRLFLMPLFCLILTALAPGPAHAQQEQLQTPADLTAPIMPKADDKLLPSLDDVPDEYIEEAYQFGERCKQDTQMRQYKDCECMAAKYLDRRIAGREKIDSASILMSLERDCVDATEAAGVHFDKCMANGVMTPTDIPIEDYCTCFANTYVELFEAIRPEPGSGAFIKLQTRASMTCREPGRIPLRRTTDQ